MSPDPFDPIIGQSRAAEGVRTFGRRAATVCAPVLLLGESGTGKGVLARAIHHASTRGARPFVAINCAAVPDTLFESEFFGHVRGAFTGAQYTHKGLFEQAHTGTLFLDEIGELPQPAQAKLLTAIEDRVIRRVGAERPAPVDVRIIAATTLDVFAASATGRFRVDLLHRLSVLNYTLPPLRARNGDLRLLAELFLREFSTRHQRACAGFSECATAALYAHHWPGNIRELANVVETAVLYCDDALIHARHLSIQGLRTAPVSQNVPGRYGFAGPAADENTVILQTLSRCRGNKSQAAMELGMSRNTLHNKLRRLAELRDTSGQH
jgi:two-component system response regulator HydG